MTKKKKKVVKAWAFLTSDGNFIADIFSTGLIHLAKPKARTNPFDYGSKKKTWKPTELTITFTSL